MPSLRKHDVKTLPKGKWVKVRIPLYYQGHVYREGSRLRVIVSAPGGDQPIWAFARDGAEQHSLGRGRALAQAAVAARPAGRAERRRSDAATGMPGAAR